VQLAAVCRDARARREAAASVTHAAEPDLYPALEALDLAAEWPVRAALHRHDFRLPAGADATPQATLWCSAGWQAAMGRPEMALDLCAALDPADWLERMEDRLLDAACDDPGPYAALTAWTGHWPCEHTDGVALGASTDALGGLARSDRSGGAQQADDPP
jgi:hypothetical protein